jgi:hypothetical protein
MGSEGEGGKGGRYAYYGRFVFACRTHALVKPISLRYMRSRAGRLVNVLVKIYVDLCYASNKALRSQGAHQDERKC